MRAPHARADLGDLYVVAQGGSDRQGQAFAHTVASTYFQPETDGITSALLAAMHQASYAVVVEASPSEEPTALGATSVVIANGVLYVAQITPTQLYILRDSAINALPDQSEFDKDRESSLDIDQEVDLFRATLQAGDCLLLTSTDLRHELTEREIRGMLIHRSAQEAAHDMCALVAQRGGRRCEVVVVQIESIESPAPVPAENTAHAPLERPTNAPLPGDEWEPRQPQESATSDQFTRYPSTRLGPDGLLRQRTLIQRLTSLPITLLTLVVVLPVVAVRAISQVFFRGDNRTHRTSIPELKQETGDHLDDDWSTLRDLRASGPGSPHSNPRSPPPPRPLDHVGVDISGGRAQLLARRRRTFPGPGTLLFGLSLVLLIVMAVVLVLRNSGDGPGEPSAPSTAINGTVTPDPWGPKTPETLPATEFITRSQEIYREAMATISSGNRAATLLLLGKAKDLANEAKSVDPARQYAPDIKQLLDDIERAEELLNRVTKLVPSSTIGEFDSVGIGTALEPLAVRLNAKFVIDSVSGRVLSYAAARQGATALRKGDVVSSVTVTDPVAVIDRSLSTIVVDARFNIFSIEDDQNPRLLRITGIEEWEDPVAFDNFNNNLYVLDPSANMIFKYQWTAGGYELGPTSYLDPREAVLLSGAIDIAIDGDVFVLFADSTVRRFSGGSEVSFSLSGLEGDSLRPTQIFTDVDSESLYLADPENERIVEFDKKEGSEGTFIRQFTYAGSDDFFGDILGLWVSEIDSRLIVLGKDKLRQFVLPELTVDTADLGA